jgi:ABC-type transport system involved in multi-copper enzyme maturation permease subunit
MESLAMISTLILLRLKIMLRQRFAWMSFGVGLLLILSGYSMASVSFVSPHKLYYNFSLGISFVALHLLAIYQGAQLFTDEKDRRTLQLLLVSGVSRAKWIVGNVLGFWLAFVVMDALWLLLTWLIGGLAFGFWGEIILIQVKILQAFSVLIVISLTLLSTLLLRNVLALALSASLTFFLYSVSSLEAVFKDSQTAHLMESSWALEVIKVAKILPPLEWFDLKSFVGYETSVSWVLVLGVSALGILWTSLLLGLAVLRFRKMDL